MKRKIFPVIILILAITLVVPLVSTSFAATGRFDGMTYAYLVQTQADADALPAVIVTGLDIGVLVDGDDIVISGLSISGIWGIDTINIAVDGRSNVEVLNCDLDGAFLGIYYYGSSGKVANNNVYGYEKNGITTNMPSSDGKIVKIMNNEVTGMGPVGPGSWAQNGIQVGYGAEAMVKGNTVVGNWYTGADWGASGILIFEASDTTVQGNIVTQNEFGICIETWSWFVASASNVKIVKNTISDGYIGVTISAYDVEGWWGPGYTMDDPIADNNKVANNDFANLDYGVSLTNEDSLLTNDFDTSVDNNKIVNNSFDTVGTEIDQYGDTATKMPPNA